MKIDACTCSLFTVIVAVGLWASPAARAQDDLDGLSESEFRALIRLELDDVDQLPDDEEEGLDTREELIDAFVNALGDEGDDEEESKLDLEDLEAELAELDDKVTVESLVADAVDASFTGASAMDSKMGTTIRSIAAGIETSFWNSIKAVKKSLGMK
jgi:hypothetical protein